MLLNQNATPIVCATETMAESSKMSRQLKDFWWVESYGTEKQSLKSMSVEDHKAMKIIENTTVEPR